MLCLRRILPRLQSLFPELFLWSTAEFTNSAHSIPTDAFQGLIFFFFFFNFFFSFFFFSIRLQSVAVSRNSARQRSGRAGREKAGHCYRLYTENTFFAEFAEEESSEISRTSLASVILTLSQLQISNPITFDFVERPNLNYFSSALEELVLLGALEPNSLKITPLGNTMAVFPLEPALAKARKIPLFFFNF